MTDARFQCEFCLVERVTHAKQGISSTRAHFNIITNQRPTFLPNSFKTKAVVVHRLISAVHKNRPHLEAPSQICLHPFKGRFYPSPETPVSQDQTTTILFFRRRCVVLKFQDHTMTGRCPVLGGRCLVLLYRVNTKTSVSH